MENETKIVIGDDCMDFVYKIHQTMVNQKIALIYEGEVNQTIVKAFTAMTEKRIDEEGTDSSTTKKRLYHVMVECLQNICKHAEDSTMAVGASEAENRGTGIFIVGINEAFYTVTTGNVVSNEKIEGTIELLDKVNSLNAEEISDLYKKMLRESRLSEKAGAGLGFIDIIKKTGNKLMYHVEKVSDNSSYIILKSTITREQ